MRHCHPSDGRDGMSRPDPRVTTDGSMQVVRRVMRSLVPGRKPAPRPPLARLEGITYTDDPVIERLVFICGLHRSGTTALERLLVSRYRLACLRANRPVSEGQHLQSVYSPARAFGGPGRFAFSRAMMQELEGLRDHADCRERILADWRRFVVGTAPVLLEKSPPNLTKIWWLRSVFPGSRFVVVTRDPRAVAAATQKWSGTSLTELMLHWKHGVFACPGRFQGRGQHPPALRGPDRASRRRDRPARRVSQVRGTTGTRSAGGELHQAAQLQSPLHRGPRGHAVRCRDLGPLRLRGLTRVQGPGSAR